MRGAVDKGVMTPPHPEILLVPGLEKNQTNGEAKSKTIARKRALPFNCQEILLHVSLCPRLAMDPPR